jgi:hypothetical protein
MAVRDNPLQLVLGLVVLATATVTFGISDVEFLNNTIEPYAIWVFILGMVGIYLWSDVNMGEMSQYEAVSVILPLVAAGAIQVIPEASNFLSEYSPFAGIFLVMVTLGSFYALGTNVSFNILAAELVLGGTLFIVAAVQYSIVNIEVLNNNIESVTIWVFIATLVGAYLLSERDIGMLETTELTALAVGVGGYLAFEFIPEVNDFVINNNPAAGIVLTIAVVVSYFVLMQNGNIYPNI